MQNNNITLTVVNNHSSIASFPATSDTSSPRLLYLNYLTPLRKKIARHISYYARKKWGFCEKTYQTIANEVGCSYDTVYETMKLLKQWGLARIKCMGNSTPKISIIKKLSDYLFKTGRKPDAKDNNSYIYKNKKDRFASFGKKEPDIPILRPRLTFQQEEELKENARTIAESRLNSAGVLPPEHKSFGDGDYLEEFGRYNSRVLVLANDIYQKLVQERRNG